MKRGGPCGEGKARPVGIVFHSAVVAAQGAEVFEKRVEAVQGQSVGGLADGFFRRAVAVGLAGATGSRRQPA